LGRKTGGPKERAGLEADGPAGKKRKGEGVGRWAGKKGERERRVWVFFSFFPTILNHFSKPFKNQTHYTIFANFHKPFSQLFLKTFKAT
jgi:hypothetical protein